jgi:hypothetical protein
MKITAIDKSRRGATAGGLNAGDVFILDACPRRKLSARKPMIMLWPHTRFGHIRCYQSTKLDNICVYLHNGKLSSVADSQPVLQLDADNIRLAIKEDRE